MSYIFAKKWKFMLKRTLVLLFASTSILAIVIVLLFFMLGNPASDPAEQVDFLTHIDSGTEDLAGYCQNLVDSDNRYVGTSQRDDLINELEAPLFQSPSWIVDVHIALAHDYLRFGETGQAVELLERRLNKARENGFQERYKVRLLEALAVTYLKMGEVDNCLSPDGALI